MWDTVCLVLAHSMYILFYNHTVKETPNPKPVVLWKIAATKISKPAKSFKSERMRVNARPANNSQK